MLKQYSKSVLLRFKIAALFLILVTFLTIAAHVKEITKIEITYKGTDYKEFKARW